MKLLTVVPTDTSGDGTPDIVAITTSGALMRYSYSAKGLIDQRQIGQNWKSIKGLAAGATNSHGATMYAVNDEGQILIYGFYGDSWSDTTDANRGLLFSTGISKDLPKYTDGQGSDQPEAFANIVSVGDLNGDGASDLISRRSDGMLIGVYANADGDLGFHDAVRVGSGWNTYSLVF